MPDTKCTTLHPDDMPQGSLVENESEFRCSICNKTYSRRDLRDRHRRRCIKSIGKERPSKRKSCETCAQKKLRCSMARPACARCLQFGIQCQYPRFAVPVHHQAQEDERASPGALWMSSTTSTGGPVTIQPFFLQDIETVEQNQVDVGGSAWGALMPDSTDPMVSTGIFTDIDTFQDTALVAPISWNEEFELSSQSLGLDEGMFNSISSNHSTTSSSQQPFDRNTGVAYNIADTGSHPDVTMSPLSFNTGSVVPDMDPSVSGSSYRDAPYADFNIDTSAQLTFARDFHPQPPYNHSILYRQLLTTLREYPSILLQREHWSPFVHHRLYRCAMGGMAKPLGVALACVSAHAGSYGSNHGFVDNLVNAERAQLVRNFGSFLDTPESCIAAVHAVCIYQILGLFGHIFLPAAVKQGRDMSEAMEKSRVECEREAELHSSFLLKMTRRLYTHHRAAITTPSESELNWKRWEFAESLRRNIFLAHIINIFGSRAGKLSGSYFEPLDDEMILDLPLPAPEAMWRACSLREWLGARDDALGPSIVTGSGDREGKGEMKVAQTLRDLMSLEAKGSLDVSALLPLTRVIWACGKIAPSGGL